MDCWVITALPCTDFLSIYSRCILSGHHCAVAIMNGGLELDTIDDKGLQKSPYHSEIEPVTKEERDAQVLARLGKKSVLEV